MMFSTCTWCWSKLICVTRINLHKTLTTLCKQWNIFCKFWLTTFKSNVQLTFWENVTKWWLRWCTSSCIQRNSTLPSMTLHFMIPFLRSIRSNNLYLILKKYKSEWVRCEIITVCNSRSTTPQLKTHHEVCNCK